MSEPDEHGIDADLEPEGTPGAEPETLDGSTEGGRSVEDILAAMDTPGPMPPAQGSADPVATDEAAPDDDGGQPAPVLEMRQVAGLTSGSIMDLHVGSFQFHESESDVGFAIVVEDTEEAVVVPGTAEARVDEVPVTEPSPIYDSVLNVGSACFTVRRPRPAADASSRLAALEETRRGPGAIAVPDLTVPDGGPTQNRGSRFGALFSRSEGEAETLDRRWWDFLEAVRDGRSLVAERHRRLHPDPEELRSRLDRLDPGLWDRTRNHPLFGRIALAYATVPWEPRFDDPERIPTELHGLIREMSQLPWVPVTTNLTHGPLGIVGPRAATLAATRHAVLSLACLSAPTDVSFSIVTAKGLIDSWSWTSALPNSLFADGRPNAFPIAIADGMVHFDGAGLAHEAVMRNEMGLIALAESPDELPEYCGTILHISPDGRCMVSNHLGEQIPGTPIGVTAGFAASMASRLTEAIGDEDATGPRTRPAVPPPERPRRRPAPEPVEPVDEADDLDGIADEVAEQVGRTDDPLDFLSEADDPGDVGREVRDTQDIEADDFADELSELFSPRRDG